MRLFLAVFLLLPLEKFAQSSLDYLNSLPEEIRDQILEEPDLNKVEIENSLNDTDKENNEENIVVKEPFYGYSFFKKFSDTNAPVLDIP